MKTCSVKRQCIGEGVQQMLFKNIVRNIVTYTLIVGMVILAIPSMNTSAETAQNCDTDLYSSNDVLFYNPCENQCSSGDGSVIELPLETVKYLDGRDIRALAEANMDRYKAAEAATGVLWPIVAALHYREAGMDSTKSVFNGAALGSGTNVDGKEVVSDPNQDAINAAKTLVELADSVYDIKISKGANISTEQWGQAFLAYNRGFLYEQNGKTYDQSPYVMNGFDNEHMNMSWVGKPADPAVSGVDGNKAGALAVLAYLAVNVDTIECESEGSAVAGDVIKTALAFALDRPASDGETDVSLTTEAYANAFPNFNSAAFAYPAITDCGRFVSTVMRASGVDTDFKEVGVGNLIDYMDGSSKYQALGQVGFDQLLPGDILATPGHIILYTGQTSDGSSYYAVDASFHDRVPSVRPIGGVTWMIDAGAYVWRFK